MFNVLLDLLFPRVSLCGMPGTIVTDDELRAMCASPVLLDTAKLRRRGSSHLDRLAAGCVLDASPLVRTALHRFKYRRVRALGDTLADSLLAPAARLLAATDNAVLCPVPLHWMRLYARGYNQADDLARHLAAHTRQSVMPLLRRRVPTGTQTKRTREERLRAMRGVFTLRETQPPAHVILIDDVATTLSTLEECARTLKSAGVARVDALAIALG